jgi:glycosyltransferase involved in cell wall biosynthesis
LADCSDVSIVIPAMNEADAIGGVVSQLRGAARWREIIVVDDGSADDTGARAREAGACVVRHPYNKGNGAAVKTGIRRASGEFVLIVDADGQHPPEDARRIAARLGDFDLVIGARNGATQASAARRAGNALLNNLASYLTSRPIRRGSAARGPSASANSSTCSPTASRRRRRRRSPSSRRATTSPSSRSTRGSGAAARRSASRTTARASC